MPLLRVLFILLSTMIFFVSCNASPEKGSAVDSVKAVVKVDADTTVRIKKFDGDSEQKMLKVLNSAQFNGSCIVLRKDGATFVYSNGLSDRKKNSPNDTSTLFHIASVSKHFTALAIMNLVEKGKVDPAVPAANYLKLKFPYQEIKVKNLLDHTSGLPDFNTLPGGIKAKGKGPENDEIISAYISAKTPLKFTPGSKFDYVNTNYIVLASIIENVSGKPFEEFVRSELFGKAGDDRIYQNIELEKSNLPAATGYPGLTGEKPVSNSETDLYCMRKGSGGLWTSASTLATWYKFLLFKDNKYTDLLRTYKPGAGTFILGWYRSAVKKEHYYYNHGVFPGFGAWCAYLPASEEIIILLSNNSSNIQNTGVQLINAILDASTN